MSVSLLAKNLGINAIYYAITLGVLPAIALALDPWPRLPFRAAGAIAMIAGAVLQFWCIVLFHRRGRGTPNPALPPRMLVTAGPYSIVRNPMNVGELLVFAGMAAWFGSLALMVYAAGSWLAFHLFITRYEEPRLAATFGAEYEAYRGRVGRWM